MTFNPDDTYTAWPQLHNGCGGSRVMPPAQQAPQRWEQIESVEAEMTDDVAVTVRDNTVFNHRRPTHHR